jgi:hypothetical protein
MVGLAPDPPCSPGTCVASSDCARSTRARSSSRGTWGGCVMRHHLTASLVLDSICPTAPSNLTALHRRERGCAMHQTACPPHPPANLARKLVPFSLRNSKQTNPRNNHASTPKCPSLQLNDLTWHCRFAHYPWAAQRPDILHTTPSGSHSLHRSAPPVADAH